VKRRLPFDWRRVVVYTHRWLGITGSLIFVAWYASGIVMMYARMPALTPAERLARLPPLDLSAVRVSPEQAASQVAGTPAHLRIGMLGGRAVYRFLDGNTSTTIFADNGEILTGVSADQAAAEAQRFAPEHAATARYDRRLRDPDQWTLEARGSLPMHRVALGDADRSYIYLSEHTGEVVQKTTSQERTWAYAGAVVHWLYFTPFRRHATLWAQSIIWLSIGGIAVSLLGMLWGIWRYSPIRRYRLKRTRAHSPYSGWMHWHHYAGLVFGLTTLTWVFSGLLSMDPWDWHPSTSPTRRQLEVMSGGALRLDLLTIDGLQRALRALGPTTKEVNVVQLRGKPFLLAVDRLVSITTPDADVVDGLDRDELFAASQAAMPDVPVGDAEWLQHYDAYYYDREGLLALPVLRVKFRDPPYTWLYVDPRRGTIVRKEERLTRVNRWLYHGLHSLDFPFLYDRRPLWDIVVVVLSLGGLALSTTTMVPAWRRLRRHWRRVIAAS
jgi:hypothetical protein